MPSVSSPSGLGYGGDSRSVVGVFPAISSPVVQPDACRSKSSRAFDRPALIERKHNFYRATPAIRSPSGTRPRSLLGSTDGSTAAHRTSTRVEATTCGIRYTRPRVARWRRKIRPSCVSHPRAITCAVRSPSYSASIRYQGRSPAGCTPTRSSRPSPDREWPDRSYRGFGSPDRSHQGFGRVDRAIAASVGPMSLETAARRGRETIRMEIRKRGGG